jgi:hypothetical protein
MACLDVHVHHHAAGPGNAKPLRECLPGFFWLEAAANPAGGQTGSSWRGEKAPAFLLFAAGCHGG